MSRSIPFAGLGPGVVPKQVTDAIAAVKAADDARDHDKAHGLEDAVLRWFAAWVAGAAGPGPHDLRDVEATARAIAAHLESVGIARHPRHTA